MRFRKLRIAWSVGCVLAGVLLVALWVRSYTWVDSVDGRIYGPLHYDVSSISGCLVIVFTSTDVKLDAGYSKYLNLESNFKGPRILMARRSVEPNFDNWILVVSDGFVIALLGVLAAVPWFRWRFSLRTLFIGTTLTAVAIGLLMYAVGS